MRAVKQPSSTAMQLPDGLQRGFGLAAFLGGIVSINVKLDELNLTSLSPPGQKPHVALLTVCI